ncbi:hypothetical protein BAE44_0019995 [Dichanthelium oligosanthes]|uniref:C2H2-type domain-containing protein n=1 Tax=Dichanthelium oligosanthes TaxID=888268 RepID=A0A1E5V1M3_9POAL|nr:hypothetical protein BAE44_0019995 [Dichanthelium oligosanthes]
MKHHREQQEEVVSLALSLSTTDSGTTSDSTTASPAAKRARRRGPVVATSGEGEFVCKTCNRAFTSFQALGGHRTSHLRGRHGLDLGVVGAKALRQHKQADVKGADKQQEGNRPQQQHECHICGLGFEMGQALGGHMRRHREEMGAAEAADAWVWRSVSRLPEELELRRAAAAEPPVLDRPLPIPVSFMTKHPRDAGDVTLSLSLALGGLPDHGGIKKPRRAVSGEGEFVCKTCSRAFASFQALGGHRTSHLRGRHGLALGMPTAAPAKAAAKDAKPAAAPASHQCHVCGLGFEMGQALGGHMRRHREEAAAVAQAPPVLLQLFV